MSSTYKQIQLRSVCVCVCVCGGGYGCVQSRGMCVCLSACVNIQEGKFSSQKGMRVWGDNYEVQGAFSVLPQRVSSRIRLQFVTLVSNLNMLLYISFLSSLSHFPAPSIWLLKLPPHKTICLQVLSQGLLSREPKLIQEYSNIVPFKQYILI